MSTDDSFSPEVFLVASFLLLLSLVRYYLGLHSDGASEDVSDTASESASASESTSVGVGVLHKQRSGVDSNHDDDTSAVSDSSFGSRGRDSSTDITPSAPPTSNEYPYLLSHGPEQFTISSKQKLIDECGSYEESLQKGAFFKISSSSKNFLKLKYVTLSQDARSLKWPSAWYKGKKNGRKIYLNNIIRIQNGQRTKFFEKKKDELHHFANTSFSLIYGNSSSKSVDFIAPSVHVHQQWFSGLKCLISRRKGESQTISMQNMYFNDKWDLADRNGDGALSKKEILALIHAMNISMPKEAILQIYDLVDVDHSGTLNYQEYTEFMHTLMRRRDLASIWNKLVMRSGLQDIHTNIFNENAINVPKADDVVTWNLFSKFWLVNQKEDPGQKFTRRMSLLNIDGFTDGESTPSEISFSMFCDIMNTCCAFDPKKKVEYQDMTRPLTNYFIATSHNTYLTGDQIKSHSSYQRYIDDLVGGCRCVEIDIWDGGEKENYDPVVYHGHTLTSKISFREVVEVCAQYAFASTPYPLILSLENHCSLEQQKIVADTLKAEFGDSLLLPGELIVAETLPSPEQLKYRVLVKGKRPMMLSRVLSGKSNSSQSASDFSYDENNNYDSNDSDNDDDDDTDDERVHSNSFSTGKIEDPVHHVHPDLAAITYLKAYNLRNIKSESDAVSFPPDVILSCSESKFLEMTSDDSKTAVLKLLCRRHLMRFYPKGSRINSSNMDPVPMWAVGGQCAALNYQTAGSKSRLNQSKFLENGGVGYVIKPFYLLSASLPVEMPKLRLTIRIISGQMLPKPDTDLKGEVIDPYVVLTVCDDSNGISACSTVRTETVTNNGFNPCWDEIFSFEISQPLSSFLYIKILDEDGILEKDDFIGYCTVPISCLLEGFRHFRLYGIDGTRKGDVMYASIFSQINIETIN